VVKLKPPSLLDWEKEHANQHSIDAKVEDLRTTMRQKKSDEIRKKKLEEQMRTQNLDLDSDGERDQVWKSKNETYDNSNQQKVNCDRLLKSGLNLHKIEAEVRNPIMSKL